MRKLLVLFVLFGFLSTIGALDLFAQAETAEAGSIFQVLKEKFIEGGWEFMSVVLVCLILGLAFCIERIITLNIATTNTDKLVSKIDERLSEGDLEIGMIGAFDKIEAVGDISPSIVAGGIKVALLTTVFGLVVAIILQIFYNYIISKIDGIVNKMEDASIGLVEVMSRNGVWK